jgi:peroxiredoxin Q/BCP
LAPTAKTAPRTSSTRSKTAKKETAKKAVKAAPTATAIKAKTTAKSAPKASKPAKAIAKPTSKAKKPTAEGGIAVGAAAPDFKLQDDTGSTVSLKDFRGKKVILYFYPKDMTGGCTQESCDFRDNLNRLTGKGAVVLGVSADTVESHKRFKAKYGFNFPLLADPDKQAIGAYGVWQEKSLYGRKFMGIVRTTYIIDGEGKVATVFPKVKVAGHVDAVLAAL